MPNDLDETNRTTCSIESGRDLITIAVEPLLQIDDRHFHGPDISDATPDSVWR